MHVQVYPSASASTNTYPVYKRGAAQPMILVGPREGLCACLEATSTALLAACVQERSVVQGEPAGYRTNLLSQLLTHGPFPARLLKPYAEEGWGRHATPTGAGEGAVCAAVGVVRAC